VFFPVAMNTHKKVDPKNKVIWWNCVAFGEVAEDIAITFKKGSNISVTESSIELTIDKRNNSDQMQVKVWKAVKPTKEGDKSSKHVEPARPDHGMSDEEIPF